MKHRKYFEPLNEKEEPKYGNDEHFEVVLLIAVGTIMAMVIYRFLGVF